MNNSNLATPEETLQRAIDRFWETIPPVWNTIRGNIRGIATDQFGITVEQFHILRHIRKGIGSVSELATVKQISRSAISQAVDILVDKGLISRHAIAADRRCVQLELTPAGNDLLNAIFEKNRLWMVEKLAILDPGEIDTLIHALEILKRTFLDPGK